jgi:hypothetical protein
LTPPAPAASLNQRTTLSFRQYSASNLTDTAPAGSSSPPGHLTAPEPVTAGVAPLPNIVGSRIGCGRSLAGSGLDAGTAAPRTQPPDRLHRQRLPPGYGPCALARLHVVRDAGEQPAQLDRGRQLAATIESGADRCSVCLSDDEHPGSMGEACHRLQADVGLLPASFIGCRRSYGGASEPTQASEPSATTAHRP